MLAAILYLLAAVLTVLKIMGMVTISWWIIAGIAVIPMAFALMVFLIAFVGILIAEWR
jgi:hypothetical protein